MTDKIYDIWSQLAETSSTKEKLNILTSNKDNEILKKWLYYTYNPYLTFGIASAPQEAWDNIGASKEPYTGKQINEQFFYLLDSLHNRAVTGNTAKQVIEVFFSKVDEQTAELFEAVLNKDIDAGVSITTINKVWDKLIPTFNIAKANPFDNSIQYPCTAEVKMNGVRLIAKYHKGNITLYSSNGRVAEGILSIENAISDIVESYFPDPDKVSLVLDGELTDINRRSVSGIFNKALKGTIQPRDCENLIYTVFDIMTGKEWGDQYSETPQRQRHAELKELLSIYAHPHIELIESRIVNSEKEINDFYQEVINSGGEGLIIKDPEAPYSFTRNSAFQKIKAELEADLKITGYTQGTGKRQHLIGAIEAETSDGKIKVKVGSGLTDQDLEYFTNNKDKLLNKIITVMYNAVIQDKDNQLSLFLPRFIELRSDKTTADSMEKVIAESGTSEL